MSQQHTYDTGEQVAELYSRLRTLAAGFTDAGSSRDFQELFTIIHAPDWTRLTGRSSRSCRRTGARRSRRWPRRSGPTSGNGDSIVLSVAAGTMVR